LTTRRATASKYPHRAPCHKLIAANAQATQTAHISTTAHTPILVNPSRARGLSSYIGSRKLPGNSSETEAIKLIDAPNKKKMLRAVIPIGRVLDLVFISIYNVAA